MFSSAGIAEQYLADAGIDIFVANELLLDRAQLYRNLYPSTNMICGDITDDKVFTSVVDAFTGKLDFLIASPPCQGMSIAGKNRHISQMLDDKRNFLVFRIIEMIRLKSPDFVLIENVPAFLKLKLPFEGRLMKITEILEEDFGGEYIITPMVYDSADYGVPQRRQRAMLRMYRKNRSWGEPEKLPTVTVRMAIGNLPSLEAGEKSDLKWHFARKHSTAHIEWMRHTPTGQSAFDNPEFYPTRPDGTRIKSYGTTYRRMKWDEPAPTITMRNDAISSQQNVHPGRAFGNGLYSDARVLTPLELMLLSSLPADWNIPDDTPEILIRKCIGECIPPLMVKQIVSQIGK